MSNGELQTATETPKTHTLRVAVFDFYEDILVTRHGSTPLFHDVQELNENGLVGIPHERRATLITDRQLMGRLGLKAVGGRFSIEDHEGNKHDAYATMTIGPASYKFFRSAMTRGLLAKRRSLDEVYRMVDNSISLHNVDPAILPESARQSFNLALEEVDKEFDPVDALVLDKARNSIDELRDYRS